MVVVQAVTAAALPAYTLISGTIAGGDAVIEANANGAFPMIDVNATVTAAASGEPASSRILLHHAPANTDNGVWCLILDPGVGGKWRLKMYSGLTGNTVGTKLRVVAGEQCAGAEYVHIFESAFTRGTTALYYHRTDPMMSPNEGVRFRDDCGGNIGATNGSATPGYLTITALGTSSQILPAFPTSGAHGEYSWSMGTSATAQCTIGYLGGVGVATNTDIDVCIRWQSTNISTVAQEYALNIGLTKETAANQHNPTNGMCVVYDRVNKGTNLFIMTVSGGTSTSTYVDTGLTYTAGRRYRLRITKRAGEDIVRYTLKDDAGNSFTTSHSTNIPNGQECFPGAFGFRITGTTTVAGALVVDQVNCDVQYPTRIAA